MSFKKIFEISNPSAYNRSDYVEVDLDVLNVPPELGEKSLKLSRKAPDGSWNEIAYQIDFIMGKDKGRRLLIFLAEDTPPSGTDKYDRASSMFLLEEGSPREHLTKDIKEKLWVEHFYEDDKDRGIKEFREGRLLRGVKLNNNRICFYLCLLPLPDPGKINFAGAITTLEFQDLIKVGGALVGEMLARNWKEPSKRWGQLTHISFFPLPWQLEEFELLSLLDKKHELVFSNSGPIRAIVTLKIGPFNVTYNGKPLFNIGPIDIESYIYRILYVYKDCPYYIEEILSETCQGTSISFRPYFTSLILYPDHKSQLKRFEGIPDYFSLWKSFSELHYGFGFAADAHVRQIQMEDEEIRWRLPFSHHNKCIHYFMFHGIEHYNVDLFHAIGHDGWYEKVFKPLEAIPYKKKFLAPNLDDYEPGERI